MKFSECLKMYRLRAGMTQFELANKLKVSPATVSKYEVGSVIPDVDRLIMLSKIFNISTDTLLGLNESEITNVEPSKYNSNELELLELFKQLPDEYKYEVKGYIRGIIASNK